jgi:hypothetical protein
LAIENKLVHGREVDFTCSIPNTIQQSAERGEGIVEETSIETVEMAGIVASVMMIERIGSDWTEMK